MAAHVSHESWRYVARNWTHLRKVTPVWRPAPRYTVPVGPFILVRHAQPLRETSLPPAQWDLDPNDIGAISEVADALRGLDLKRFRTSSEPKAVQTGRPLAELLDVPTEQDIRLNEVLRPRIVDDGAFRKGVKSYLNGGHLTGWEAQEDVVRRMSAAVADAHDIGLVGLVSHGIAISLLVEHLGLVRAWGFWMQLASPDAWLVDGCTIRRLGAEV